MKKVLVVAYLYPPIFNSGTRRSLEFVNHLPDCGWTPIVLTVANPSPKDCDASLLEEVRPGTRIERAPLWGAHIGRKVETTFPFFFRENRIAQGLAWRVQRAWNVPDACGSWVPTAVAHGKRLHLRERFDAIYATGWPWSSFLVAEKISRAIGVPFILDYRDLWKASDAEWDKSTGLQRRLNPLLERRVLRRASGVIATTESFLKLLPQACLPEHRFAITNGFNEKEFSHDAIVPPPQLDKVTIAYTGVWRPGYGPEDLYSAIRLLHARNATSIQQLRVAAAGFPPGLAKEYGIDSIVEEHGRVPHAKALSMLSHATSVYLPVSTGLYEYASIPGKLFEYLGSGRPILSSTKADSEVARVLDRVGGACRVGPGDVESLAARLETLCRGEEIFTERLPGELAQYTRSNLTQKLAAALDAIVSEPRP